MTYGRTRIARLLLAALLLAGCARQADNRTDGPGVKVEGIDALPDGMAGRWKADQYGWEFAFGPEGRLGSAVISFGRVEVLPGQVTTVPTRSGDEGRFVPGPWTVHYEPDARTLTLRIVMDHVRVEMAGNVVEGSSMDVFTGPVDPRQGVWQAQWTTFAKYTARAPDGTAFDMSTDATYGETKSLTFTRQPGP